MNDLFIYLLNSTVGGWDSYDSFVIVAKSAEEARAIAADKSGSEGPMAWLIKAKIEELGTYTGVNTEGHVVLGSFNAG